MAGGCLLCPVQNKEGGPDHKLPVPCLCFNLFLLVAVWSFTAAVPRYMKDVWHVKCPQIMSRFSMVQSVF